MDYQLLAVCRGGVPDLIKKENGILVEPGDVESIKNAIIALKNNEPMRSNMGMENRKKVINHYSWEGVTAKYVAYYKKCLLHPGDCSE